jgi:hypothetical protein
MDELGILVRYKRVPRLQCEEERTTTKERLEVSIELRRNKRKNEVKQISLPTRPFQKRGAFDMHRLWFQRQGDVIRCAAKASLPRTAQVWPAFQLYM